MARDYDGTAGQKVDTGKLDIASATALTVCAWVRSRAPGFNTLFSNWSNTSTHAAILCRANSGTDKVQFFYRSNTGAAPSAVTANSMNATGWSHVAYRLDDVTDNEVSIFIDGVKDANTISMTNPMHTTNSSSNFFFGGSPHSSTASWKGDLCEGVVFENTVLTDEQIAALAKGASPLRIGERLSANPDSRYLPINGDLSTEPDLSGNANHGTVAGTLPKVDHAPISLLMPLRSRWQLSPAASGIYPFNTNLLTGGMQDLAGGMVA